jgi:hypothetical protein
MDDGRSSNKTMEMVAVSQGTAGSMESEMCFDPETGTPIGGAAKEQWKSDATKFDPETGLPIGGGSARQVSETGQQGSTVRTSNVGKYSVGQRVHGLAGGTVNGTVAAVRADAPGGVAGPGTLSIEPFLQTSVRPASNVRQSSSLPTSSVSTVSTVSTVSQPTNSGSAAGVALEAVQTYRVCLGFQLSLREQPTHDGKQTGLVLTQGSTFEVEKIKVSE